MAQDSTQMFAAPSVQCEGLEQGVAILGIGCLCPPLQLGGHSGPVAPYVGQHGLSVSIETVEIGQARTQSLSSVAELAPRLRARKDLSGGPVLAAGREQGSVVRKVPIDGQSGYAGLSGKSRDRCGRWPYCPVQPNSSLDDALTCHRHVIGSLLHPVTTDIGGTLMFTQVLTALSR
jgi:hypothetical protein